MRKLSLEVYWNVRLDGEITDANTLDFTRVKQLLKDRPNVVERWGLHDLQRLIRIAGPNVAPCRVALVLRMAILTLILGKVYLRRRPFATNE